MGVAGHLRIELAEYDQRIRTFVPWYEALIATAAEALGLLEAASPVIVDLGTGTGALAQACIGIRPAAQVIGMDLDPGMLEGARARLAGHERLQLRQGSFLDDALPAADAMVACISLHHIPQPAAKQALYRRIFQALRPGGMLVNADCFPARHAPLAARQRDAWLAHLMQSYSRAEAEGYLEAWAGEDTFFPLETELEWLREAGLRPETFWRRDGFAVIAGFRDQ